MCVVVGNYRVSQVKWVEQPESRFDERLRQARPARTNRLKRRDDEVHIGQRASCLAQASFNRQALRQARSAVRLSPCNAFLFDGRDETAIANKSARRVMATMDPEC